MIRTNMTVCELKEILNESNCRYEIIKQDKPILSVSDAESYYPIEKSAPTFVLQTENGLIGCITSMQNGRLDFEIIKTQLGFEKLKMADKKKVEKQIGYLTGCIPLAGLGIPSIFDRKLLVHDCVYGGTGDELLTLKINPNDLLKVNDIIGMFE